MENPLTKRQKELLVSIYQYIKDTGFPPTFEEMRRNLGVSSNQSILDLLQKLEKQGFVKREESTARGLAVLPLGYTVLDKSPLAPFFGVTSAGTPIEAVEITGEWRPISQEVAELKGDVFLLRISGDSMINAGIDDGDVILVQDKKEFSSGDIVLAEVGDEATVKRFISDDKPPFIYLKPENPNYDNIPFTEETRLKGKVISVLKDEHWKPVK